MRLLHSMPRKSSRHPRIPQRCSLLGGAFGCAPNHASCNALAIRRIFARKQTLLRSETNQCHRRGEFSLDPDRAAPKPASTSYRSLAQLRAPSHILREVLMAVWPKHTDSSCRS